jgi:pyrroloquinoline quinone (PQQ) biosynthesis protein C
MFQTYTDVEKAMDQLVQAEFMDGIFFKTLQNGEYTIPQVQFFAVQYSYYSRHFPRVLGAAISAMAPLDTWWVPLADNLWDEAGRGAPGKSHEQLYHTFLRSIHPNVELDQRGVPLAPMSNAVSTAIQTFIDFFRSAAPLEAMAAVGLGSEMFAGAVMGTIANGLRHEKYNTSPLNLLFWDVHADEHEPHHYQLCKDILVQFTQPKELETMYTVGAQIAKSEALMYAQLHEEMTSIQA